MKILKKSFEKDGGGTVSLLPDEDEDMWHVFNLVAADEGDRVKASTVRKVAKETASGGSESQRMRVTLEVVIEDVDYDPVRPRTGQAPHVCMLCISAVDQLTKRGTYRL